MSDDTQDKLVQAYLEYFKANEWWEQKRSIRGYYAANRWLREIRKLAKTKQEENTDYFYDIKGARKHELANKRK
jgi:hypothetical protein